MAEFEQDSPSLSSSSLFISSQEEKPLAEMKRRLLETKRDELRALELEREEVMNKLGDLATTTPKRKSDDHQISSSGLLKTSMQKTLTKGKGESNESKCKLEDKRSAISEEGKAIEGDGHKKESLGSASSLGSLSSVTTTKGNADAGLFSESEDDGTADDGDEECDEEPPAKKRLKRANDSGSSSSSHKKNKKESKRDSEDEEGEKDRKKTKKRQQRKQKKHQKQQEERKSKGIEKPRVSWVEVVDSLSEDALLSGYERVLERAKVLASRKMWLPSIEARQAEPVRRKAHWDMLLDEMAWLSEDYVYERKWKKALAAQVACQCAIAVKLRKAHAKREYVKKRKIASLMSSAVMAFWEEAGSIAATLESSTPSLPPPPGAAPLRLETKILRDLKAQLRSISTGESVVVTFQSRRCYDLLAGSLVHSQDLPKNTLVVAPLRVVVSLQCRCGSDEAWQQWQQRQHVCVISFESLFQNFGLYKGAKWDLCVVVAAGLGDLCGDEESLDRKAWMCFVNTVLESAPKRVLVTDSFPDPARTLFTFQFTKHITFSLGNANIVPQQQNDQKITFVEAILTPLQRELLRCLPAAPLSAVFSIGLHPYLAESVYCPMSQSRPVSHSESPCLLSAAACIDQPPFAVNFGDVCGAKRTVQLSKDQTAQSTDAAVPAITFKCDERLTQVVGEQGGVVSQLSVGVPLLLRDKTLQSIAQPRVLSVMDNSKDGEHLGAGGCLNELLNISAEASARVLKSFADKSGKTRALCDVLMKIKSKRIVIIAQSPDGQTIAKCVLGALGINFVCIPSVNGTVGALAASYVNSLCDAKGMLAVITSARYPGTIFNLSEIRSVIVFDYEMSPSSIYSVTTQLFF